MREILFKAKRIDNGEWVEGFYCKRKHYCFDKRTDELKTVIMTEFSSGGFVCYKVNPETICQYTGLTDKNGNKIWEKDILSDDDMLSAVRWDEEEARFVIDDYGTKGCLMEYGFDECMGEYGVVDTYGFDDFCSMKSFEVIGNICDNPELLEEGAENV